MKLYIYFIIGIIIGLQYFGELSSHQQTPLSDIEHKLKINPNYFKSIHFYPDDNMAYFYKNTTKPNEEEIIYKVKYGNYDYFMNRVAILYQNNTIPIFYRNDISLLNIIYSTFFNFALIFMLISLFMTITSGNNIFGSLFKKMKYNKETNENTSFDDVIGLTSVKKELKEYTNFMKHRETYIKYGFNIPKGLLFVGPPGTGKTYLAKAFAKESGAEYLSACGSDFIEIFVGTGPKRVRELFEKAKQNKKATVIFIDEIDAIGGKRMYLANNTSTEQNSTLNALLVELDGFSSADNVMIIGATNVPDVLDPALTRSGRFDKQIVFDAPNIEERKEMFKLYLNKVRLSEEFKEDMNNYINKLAKQTASLTGADIKNIVNQSVYNFLSKHEDKEKIDEKDGITYENIHKAIDEVMIGMEKPERKMTPEEIKRVSYHEAGHTLISYLLTTTTPPIKTSIIPRGLNALGYTQQEPHEKKLHTVDEIIANICVLYGGRASEEIFMENVSTGASDDLNRIDKLIELLISNCRFEEINYINIIKDGEWDNDTKIFIGNIMKKLYKKTIKMIVDNAASVIKLAEYLNEHEIIMADDINNLLGDKIRKSIKSETLLNL